MHQATMTTARTRGTGLALLIPAPPARRTELPPAAILFLATLVSALLWAAPAAALAWLLG